MHSIFVPLGPMLKPLPPNGNFVRKTLKHFLNAISANRPLLLLYHAIQALKQLAVAIANIGG